MAATTRSDFHTHTEAGEVSKEFAVQIKDKTVLITGVNRGGIGFATAQAIASQSPKRIIIAGRSPSKFQDCVSALQADFVNVDFRGLQIDLSSQKSVRKAAAEVLAWDDVPVLDILFNSAGVMAVPERTLSEDGIEMHLATNHIGHWLLTCLLMPKLIKAAEKNPRGETRIINLSSASPQDSTFRWSDTNFDKQNKDLPESEQPNYSLLATWGYKDMESKAYNPFDAYSRSKVANCLSGIAENKRLFDKYGIVAVAVHPGIINTELGRNFPPEVLEAIGKIVASEYSTFKTLPEGASTSVVAAFDPKLARGVGETKNGSENYGSYLVDCQISDKAVPLAVSSREADKLWELSEKLVGEKIEF